MSDDGSITVWIGKLRSGEPAAAAELWNSYYERLVRLARQRLRDSSRRMADEEDVVIDAFDSLCRGAQAGRFPRLDDRDDLWQVLMMLTARKATNQSKHARRQKRGGGMLQGESIFGTPAEGGGIHQVVGDEPTPEFAAQVSEETRRLLDLLPDQTLRDVALAKLHGYLNTEIAEQLQVQTRTVERKLRIIRELWSAAERQDE